jgi:hypothetical protein
MAHGSQMGSSPQELRTMLRITRAESTTPSTLLTLEGRLVGPWVTVLRDECQSTDGAVVLNLAQVNFADDAGVTLLRRLTSRGVRLQGASAFVSELLKEGMMR